MDFNEFGLHVDAVARVIASRGQPEEQAARRPR